MADTSNLTEKNAGDIAYYRRRFQNRVHEVLTAFFDEEAQRLEFTRQDVGDCIDRDPAQISRWLRHPSNLTLDTISDLLVALDAEMDVSVCRFEQRGESNFMHPLVANALATPRNVGPLIVAGEELTSETGSATGLSISGFEQHDTAE